MLIMNKFLLKFLIIGFYIQSKSSLSVFAQVSWAKRHYNTGLNVLDKIL